MANVSKYTVAAYSVHSAKTRKKYRHKEIVTKDMFPEDHFKQLEAEKKVIKIGKPAKEPAPEPDGGSQD